MLGLIVEKLFLSVKLMVNRTHVQLGFKQTLAPSTKSFSSLSAVQQNSSFTVSYLMNSYGLSLENAIIASKKVYFSTSDKPNSLLKLLKKHEFKDAQIAKLVRIRPQFLLCDSKKILSPKFDFFFSLSLSATVMCEILSSHPSLLACSLNNHLIPFYKFIKSIVKDDKKCAVIVKHYPRLLQENLKKKISPNITLLRKHGVPDSSITLLLTRHARSLIRKCDKFEKSLKKVIDLGFRSSKTIFILALDIFTVKTESEWNRKIEVYRKWGWSETDFVGAFIKFPQIVNFSEANITNTMEFIVNKMGLDCGDIAKYPPVLGLSLKKRIIPRYAVLKILILKRLVKKISLCSSMGCTEKAFLRMYVIKYKGDAPELFDVYQTEMKKSETTPFSIKDTSSEVLEYRSQNYNFIDES